MNVPEFIESAMRSDKPISSVLEALKSGALKHEEVFNHFKQEYTPVVQRALAAFGRGELFAAQKETWQEFVAGKNVQADKQAWLKFAADVDMAQMKLEQVSPICDFAYARVMSPTMSDRKELLEAEGSGAYEMARERWASTNQREGWLWRR